MCSVDRHEFFYDDLNLSRSYAQHLIPVVVLLGVPRDLLHQHSKGDRDSANLSSDLGSVSTPMSTTNVNVSEMGAYRFSKQRFAKAVQCKNHCINCYLTSLTMLRNQC